MSESHNVLLVVDVQRCFVQPPVNRADEMKIRAGGRQLLVSEAEEIQRRVERIGQTVDDLRGPLSIIWVLMGTDGATPLMTTQLRRYEEWARDIGIFTPDRLPLFGIYDLAPKENDFFISKVRDSAFNSSNLHWLLHDARTLNVCGFNTSECVNATCEGAKILMRQGVLSPDLKVRLVADLSADSYRGHDGFRPVRKGEEHTKIFAGMNVDVINSQQLYEEFLGRPPERRNRPGGRPDLDRS